MININRPLLAEDINPLIEYEKTRSLDTNLISDTFHTFGELYEHRIVLYIALCREYDDTGKYKVWRTKKHSDGTEWEGWFILGINKEQGEQVTYHLPINKWEDCEFAKDLPKAPDWDGHTSEDVLKRLKSL